jgi:peroxiredoxin
MRHTLSRTGIFIPYIAAFVLMILFSGPVHAIPAVGDPFPQIALPTPDGSADRSYLGIGGGKTFTIGDVAASVVVVEFYSMYCPHCQADAPTTVELFGRIKKDPRFSKRVRMIGIGVGNSDYEVGIFKKKYGIPFPLFSDGAYTIMGLLDIRYTPTYIVASVNKGKATVAYTQVGRIKDVESFLMMLSSVR